VLIAECGLSHVTQLDCPFAGGICKDVAVLGMKFGSSDNFCQLFHIGWLDIDYH